LITQSSAQFTRMAQSMGCIPHRTVSSTPFHPGLEV